MATRFVERNADPTAGYGDAGANVAAIGVDSDSEELKYRDRTASVNRTVVTTDQTQTLTGKTVSGTKPVVVPTVTGDITAAQSGSRFVLTAVADMVLTLPAPAAGLEYEFWSAAAALTTSHVIATNAAAAIIFGSVVVNGAIVAADQEKQINFIAAAVLPGDRCRVFSDGTSWFVEGDATAAGGITVTAP